MKPLAVVLPLSHPCEKALFHSQPKVCGWCGMELIGRRTAWCSEACEHNFACNHFWGYARPAALRRDGGCVTCGSRDRVDVNHILPVRGGRRSGCNCAHHLGNLETLCHEHHIQVTRLQIVSVRSGPTGTHRRTQACWKGLHDQCWSQAPVGTLLGGFVLAACLCECHGPVVRPMLQMELGATL